MRRGIEIVGIVACMIALLCVGVAMAAAADAQGDHPESCVAHRIDGEPAVECP